MAATMTAIRGMVVLVAAVILAYWTWRRVNSDRDDPVLKVAKGTDTSYSSLLLSGTSAVAAIAGVLTVALWPEIVAQPALALIPAGVVAAHYVVEKMEARG